MLRGEYVILRVPEIDDTSIMTAWQNDREVTKFLSMVYPISKKTQEDYLKELESCNDNISLIVTTEDEIPIGIASLNNISWLNSTAEICVVIYAKSCWGRGYGFDTVRTLVNYGMLEMNLHTVYANIIENNEKAIRCFQKAGFEVEGTLYHRLYKDGQFRNIVSMSIYKDKNKEE